MAAETDDQKDSMKEELKEYWGFKPNGKCYCGCGGCTKSYFAPHGHDTHFAAHLLGRLRNNQQVADAIRSLTSGSG